MQKAQTEHHKRIEGAGNTGSETKLQQVGTVPFINKIRTDISHTRRQ